MFKFIGSIIVVSVFSVFGIIRTSAEKRRYKNLEILIRCVKRMGTEANFTGKRAEIILTEAAIEYKLPVLRQAAKHLMTHGIKTALSDAFTQNKDKLFFTNDDVKYASLIYTIFNYSGKEQLESISTVLKLLELSYNDAKDLYLKNARLYKSGSILCGLLTAVLLL